MNHIRGVMTMVIMLSENLENMNERLRPSISDLPILFSQHSKRTTLTTIIKSTASRYLNEKAKGQKLNWSEVKSPSPETIPLYASLPKPSATEEKSALSKLAVLKLNGGLGTTMVWLSLLLLNCFADTIIIIRDVLVLSPPLKLEME